MRGVLILLIGTVIAGCGGAKAVPSATTAPPTANPSYDAITKQALTSLIYAKFLLGWADDITAGRSPSHTPDGVCANIPVVGLQGAQRWPSAYAAVDSKLAAICIVWRRESTAVEPTTWAATVHDQLTPLVDALGDDTYNVVSTRVAEAQSH